MLIAGLGTPFKRPEAAALDYMSATYRHLLRQHLQDAVWQLPLAQLQALDSRMYM